MNFHTLFDHIWTNLLTQCQFMFSAVFVFQVFPILKVLQKFRKNYIKNQRRGTFRNRKKREGGDPPRLQAPLWRDPRGGAPGTLMDPWWTPWVPPFAYILPSRRKPLISKFFSPSPLCTAAAAVSRSGLPGEAAPAPCPKEEPPPGDPPSPWTPPGCAVSSPPWTMGP